MQRPFAQVDVFSRQPFVGNPVAVVLDATGLDADEMQRLARWMNLSETTFLLPPTEPGADYAVRIFTPVLELPFAGHPTLGTCHAWSEHVGSSADRVVQQCPGGVIELRCMDERWAFAAPPLLRSGPADDALVDELAEALHIERRDIVAAEWVDNGPGWIAVLLASAEAVLAVRPGFADLDIGLVGPAAPGQAHAIEVRAFFPKDGVLVEDPVTGSLNASLGQWLTRTGRVEAPYVAAQGTVLGRAGRVHVSVDDDGQVWVAGATSTLITGSIDI